MKKFIAILVSMLCALGSLSFVGCGQKKGGANTLQIWINNAGYGVEWVSDALALFVEQDWVKEKYPEGVKYDEPKTLGGATTGLEHLVGGGTQYDIVMPTGGLTAGTYLENYEMFEDLTSLYEREIPGEGVTLQDKMIDNIAAETLLNIKGLDDPIRVSIPWINGAHGWFYNETTLAKYYPGYTYETMPRTTNEFVNMLDDVKLAILEEANPDQPDPSKWDKSKVKNWAIFHHNESVSYWTSDATVWWAQYEGVQGYNNYFEGKDAEGNIDVNAAAENTKSQGRLRALETLDEIINYENGYVYEKWHLESNTYRPTLGRLAKGEQFVFSSNGDWIENETLRYATEGQTIRMMKTPVISSIVEKLTFANANNAEEVLSEIIRNIDLGFDYANTYHNCIQLSVNFTEDDYNAIKLARNTVSRVGGHGMYIPSYSDAKELAKDFLLFLASDVGIESMMSNGIYSSYEYDYYAKEEVTADLTQMRKDFITIMTDARDIGGLLRNPESFPTVYYGKLGAFKDSQHPHIGACFIAVTAGGRVSPSQIYENCIIEAPAFSAILSSAS